MKPNKIISPSVGCGILTGIITSIPFVGILCFVWQVIGGFLAAYLLRKESYPKRYSMAIGLIVGFLAGIYETLIEGILYSHPVILIHDAIILIERMGFSPSVIVEAKGLYASIPFSILVILMLFIKVTWASVFATAGALIGRYIWR